MTQISYELALALKDAGFPQDKSPWVYLTVQTGGQSPHHVLSVRFGSRGYKAEEILGSTDAPTLQELIEACGDYKRDRGGLILSGHYKERYWTATCYGVMAEGTTPCEAVARLWLALNKK